MAQLKIVSTDPNNITIDGTPLHEWAIAHQQDTVEKLRVLREEHAAAMETLKAAHRDALAERDAKIEAQATAYTQHHEETHRAVAEWQAAQEAEKAKRQADHEAALQELAQQHARTVDTLQVDLEIVRDQHRQLREAVAELGDTPAVLEMARQAERERLLARLAALGDAAPDGAARAMAAPSFASLYRATDGQLAKVIRQLPGVVIYWEIADVATANDWIGKKMERMTLKRWQEAGFTPYDGGQS